MLITASWEGGDVVVEVDEGCRSVAALRHTLAAAVPELDAEKVCLEIGGCAADDEAVCSLCEGSVVTVSVTPAQRAAAALREEGRHVDLRGFCRAADDGDMRLCELYLDAEVHRAVPEPDCTTPLHVACSTRNLPLCTLLIERGHPLDVQDSYGETPLHEAIATKSVEVCKLLIDSGCCLELQSRRGKTPLDYAVAAQSVELCRLLIDGGCSFDVQSRVERTPLHYAAMAQSVELCALLIDGGAATSLTTTQRQSLLDVASHNGDAAIYNLLTGSGGVSDHQRPSLRCCLL